MSPRIYMWLSSFIILLVALAFPVAGSGTTKTSITCHTSYTTKKPASIRSTTRTTTQPITQTLTKTTTHTSTVVPKPVTDTLHKTIHDAASTTLPRVTHTFSTTSTVFSTLHFLATSTSTRIQTTTTYVATATTTSTVPTSPGFTPLSVALVQSGYIPGRKVKREEANDSGRIKNAIWKRNGEKMYPKVVSCTKYIEPVKVTTRLVAQTKTTTARTSTVSKTVTTTVTTTSTITPAAHSKTITSLKTRFKSSTSTVLTTTTKSTTISATTTVQGGVFYAACAEDNLVSTVDGQLIDDFGGDNGLANSGFTASAYQCCQACLFNSSCAVAGWYEEFRQCTFALNGGVCSPASPLASFYTKLGSEISFVVMNSNCGQFNYGGEG